MHAGQNTKMLPGAVWACAIPVILGSVLLISLVLMLIYSFNTEFIEDGFTAWVLTVASMALGFILSAPLSAWLACRSMAKIGEADKLVQWRTSAARAVLAATVVHFGAAIFFTVIIRLVMVFAEGASDADGGGPIGMLVVLSGLYNIGIWIFITLPLSLLCATIFWKVTKFPKDTSVF